MELEDISYLIANANRSNVTPLNLSFKGLTFLPPHELCGLENLKGFGISLNQLASLPPKVSDFKNLIMPNNSNYSSKMVK